MPRICPAIATPVAVLLFALPLAAHADKARKPVPPQPASTYACNDTHQRVTIAAEPGDTKETRPDTRLDYFSHGLMPMRIIVTNDTDKPVTLDDARIHFITASNAVIPAATLDDLQRRMFSLKSATGTKVPLPLIPVTVGKKDVDENRGRRQRLRLPDHHGPAAQPSPATSTTTCRTRTSRALPCELRGFADNADYIFCPPHRTSIASHRDHCAPIAFRLSLLTL
jgi:hypothetical protein